MPAVATNGTLVLRGAEILTQGRPARASALAMHAGRVVTVGHEGDVWSTVGSEAPSLDLGGRVVLPGFTDAHVHWGNLAMARRRVQLAPGMPLPAAVERVRERASASDGTSWILGRGWDHTDWGRWPVAADLDVVVPHRPVVLTRKDGHAVWVNSAALRAAGIGATTPDPAGGEIVRQDGRPTGVLKENAIRLVERVTPAPEPAERRAAVVDAWPEAWCRGITGCHEMGFAQPVALYHDLYSLRDAGQLGLRCVWYFGHEALPEVVGLGLHSGDGDTWLQVGGLKLYLDGTLGSQTADMLAAFEGPAGGSGLTTLSADEFADLAGRAATAGLATAVHAIGDAANRKALDGFARLAADPSSRAGRLRHRIEHAQLVDPADAPRFAALDVIASMQPIHATVDMAVADRFWGARSRYAYAWRMLLDGGARLAFGSDAPIETLDVLAGVHAAVTRQDAVQIPRDGWHPGQCMSAREAIAAYTTGAAWAAGQEDQLGSLTPGMRADLVVLDRSPFDVAPADLPAVRVLATMIDGTWVWQADDIDLGGPRRGG